MSITRILALVAIGCIVAFMITGSAILLPIGCIVLGVNQIVRG